MNRRLRQHLLLSSTVLLGTFTGYGRAYAACVNTSGSAYQCSGTNTTEQAITANNAAVTTASGFSVDTTDANAISITGDGALSYTDNNASPLTGGTNALNMLSTGDDGTTLGSVTIDTNGNLVGGQDGIYARNFGTGAVTITTSGDVEGTSGTGIFAFNRDGTDVYVTTGAGTAVYGGTTGISASGVSSIGAGVVDVKAYGRVTGGTGDGIFANNAYGTDLTVTAGADATITGGNRGIYAKNTGTGVLTIAANGDVTGTGGAGIFALADSDVTALNITTGAGTTVTGLTGISATNTGTGSLTVDIHGDVTGTGTGDTYGIVVENWGADLNITTAAGTTVRGGIDGTNNGTGDTTIITDGAVTGSDYTGIWASGNNALTITANNTVSGRYSGINASQGFFGATGPVTIVAQGDVTVTGASGTYGGAGIYARSSGTSLTITAYGNVAGGRVGIGAEVSGSGPVNITTYGEVTSTRSGGFGAPASGIGVDSFGSGAVNITTNGDVSAGGTTADGIYAWSFYTDVDIITAAGTTVSGPARGIYGYTYYGAISIEANGNVTGTNDAGIYALTGGEATNLSVTTGDGTTVSGGTSGVHASHYGTGTLVIEANGNVTGTSDAGIYALTGSDATDLNVTTGAGTAVSGSTSGIKAVSGGSGNFSIAVNGDVTGTGGDGIYAQNAAGGPLSITVASASTVASNGTAADDFAIQTAGGDATVAVSGALNGGSGGAVSFGDFANRLELQTGATVNGNVIGGTATDTLALLGSGAGTFNMAQLRNFETGEKSGSSTWTLTGTNADTMAFSVNAGQLVANATMANTSVSVASGSTLSGIGSLGDADIANGGILLGRAGQTLSMASLDLSPDAQVNVALGAPSTAGLFDVGGDLTLDGSLNITDLGGFGAGLYRLVDYGGSLTDNGMAIGTVPAGTNGSDLIIQTSIASQVNLINVSGLPVNFWDGSGAKNDGTIDGGTGTWQSPSGDDNWTDAAGALNVPWQGGSFGIFAGTGGTVTVDNSLGQVIASGMQFAVDGYVIDGDSIELAGPGGVSTIRVGDGTAAGAATTATIGAELTGNTALVKTDAGTLVLTGANTYTDGTFLNGGVLSVASDNNLGAAEGGLTFNGGTLQNTGSFTSARNVTLNATGGTFQTDADLTLSGAISGEGSLTKTGTGTLTLTGKGEYEGGTTVSAGTLQVGDGGSTGSISGDVLNNGTLAFNRSDASTFDGMISGSGLVQQIGTGTTILTGNSDYTGGTEILAGILQLGNGGESGAISGDVQNNGTLAFNRSDAFTFDSVISGSGMLRQIGSGTTELSANSSGFAGTSFVDAGTLLVTGQLGGTLVVNNGSRLAGTGTVGDTTVADGGTLSPGEGGIGTLNVAGDVTLDEGSQFEVEVVPPGSSSDLLHASGQAFLNSGTVVHIGPGGNYQPEKSYTILTADGGVQGSFGSVSSNFAFLSPELFHNADSVALKLEITANFDTLAATPNQKSTAEGLQTLDAGNPVFDAVVVLQDDPQVVRETFDSLSGELHASIKSAILDESRFLRQAANDRIRAAFDGVGAADMPVLAYGPGGPELAPADTSRFAAWGQAYGAWGEFEADGNAAELDRSTGGFFMGVDAAVAGAWRAGLAAGYRRSSFDVDARSSSADVDTATLGAYAGTEVGALGLRFGTSYSWHKIDTDRTIAFSDFGTADSSYNAGTAQVFGEAGYRIDTTFASFEPFASAAYVNLHTNGFEESGVAGLRASSQNTDATFTTLGLRAEAPFQFGAMPATVHGTLGWQHAFGDVTPQAAVAFPGGTPFTVAGTPLAADAAIIEAGFNVDVADNTALSMSYNGQIASEAQQHGFAIKLTGQF